MPTNKQLEVELENMKARNEELDQRLIAMEESQQDKPIEINELPTAFRDAPDGGGWVVRTPNKLFNGNTCGIRFVQGMAVISKDTTGAQKIVRNMTGEYGYSSQPVSEDDLDSFSRFVANNLAALIDGRSDSMEGKLMQPVFTGGVIEN